MKFGGFLMPWASFGPWQSHLGPPGAPSWPEVAIFDDIWGHFGITLELILETVGAFFAPCRLQEPKRRARAGTQNQNRFFIDFGVCPKALRRVLAAVGALFSLWRPVANNGYFGLLGLRKLPAHDAQSDGSLWRLTKGLFSRLRLMPPTLKRS